MAWVKSSAQHAAADKGRSAGLFEEEGFENNPENIMMLCAKATVGPLAGVLQPSGVIPFVKKGGAQGKGGIEVWMTKVRRGCDSLWREDWEEKKRGSFAFLSLPSARTKNVTYEHENTNS